MGILKLKEICISPNWAFPSELVGAADFWLIINTSNKPTNISHVEFYNTSSTI